MDPRLDASLRLLIGSLCVGLVAASTSGCGADETDAPAHRPNVIVFLVDDQGWGDVGFNGNTTVSTPNLDALARESAVFEHFYVQPVCSPTRAELLTGRYHPRGGVYATSAGGERLDADEHTLAETFAEAGYATGVFGKWHNGTQAPYHPETRGFDEFYGFTSGHWGHYFDWILEDGFDLVEGEGFIIDDLTDRALSFIDAHRNEPFLAYLPYNTPHSPMQVPDRFYERYANVELQDHRYSNRENSTKTRAALAMAENIDWNVGRILDRLDRFDLSEETIVVYLSDNGPNGWRWNANMRGRKGSTDEGGVRVPMVIRWPGVVASGTTISEIGGAIDLFPTLTDLADVPVRADTSLDGRSLEPLLRGTAEHWPDRRIFAHWGGNVSVRTAEYRLDAEGRLYDVDADPEQRTDLADEHPGVTDTLRSAVRQWDRTVRAELDTTNRSFPVGHPEAPHTVLPARDGIAHGSIERSNRFPNASFFRSWSHTDDSITWDVRVLRPGRYTAAVHYTLAPADTGAVLTLNFREASAGTRVTEPFDPPLVGSEHDRIPRQESYVKEFRAIELGAFELPAGRGTLALEAPRIPGDHAPDVRRVVLTPSPPDADQ